MSEVLFVAHPGHEVRVHHWLETARPLVFVMTDGSGGAAEARLDETRRTLDAVGAQTGSLFGRFTDRAIYEVIREGQVEPVIAVAEELAAEWANVGVTRVSGDMLEGFNTAHDLCRCITGAVVERLRREDGREIENWDFPLENAPDRFATSPLEDRRVISLDEDAFQRKLAVARGAEKLKPEIDRSLRLHGADAFRQEVFRRAPQPCGLEWTDAGPPTYETYGSLMVAQGRYKEVITYRRHMRPLALALWKWATES